LCLALYHCAPILGAAIPGVPGEQPVVAIQIGSGVLIFAVLGLMRLFEYLRACGFCPGIVRIQIVHENRQGLRAIPELRR